MRLKLPKVCEGYVLSSNQFSKCMTKEKEVIQTLLPNVASKKNGLCDSSEVAAESWHHVTYCFHKCGFK